MAGSGLINCPGQAWRTRAPHELLFPLPPAQSQSLAEPALGSAVLHLDVGDEVSFPEFV